MHLPGHDFRLLNAEGNDAVMKHIIGVAGLVTNNNNR